MRRSASEILRNLEVRVARLEKQSKKVAKLSSWDDPRNYDHPAYQSLIEYVESGSTVLGNFYLDITMSGSVAWESNFAHPLSEDLDLWIYVSYNSRKSSFEFTIEDEYGDKTLIDTLKAELFDRRQFLKKSKQVFSKVRKMS